MSKKTLKFFNTTMYYVCRHSAMATCGDVCRNPSGQWIVGFARKLGSSNVLMAELWGIFTALSIAWEQQLTKVWVESDSGSSGFSH